MLEEMIKEFECKLRDLIKKKEPTLLMGLFSCWTLVVFFSPELSRYIKSFMWAYAAGVVILSGQVLLDIFKLKKEGSFRPLKETFMLIAGNLVNIFLLYAYGGTF